MLLVMWRGETRATTVNAMYPALQKLTRHFPKSVGMLTVIEENAPAPSAEARAAIARLFASAADDVICSAVAFEGSGFRAAFVRGVVTSLTMLARQPFPHKVFPGVPQAAVWLMPRLPTITPRVATQAQMVEAVAQWRMAYANHLSLGSAAA
jgi:hypothetical protein